MGGSSDAALDRTHRLLQRNDIVDYRWRINNKIGQGTYSEVYSAVACDTGKAWSAVAIKAEKDHEARPQLPLESEVLLRLQKYPFFCRHLFFGCARRASGWARAWGC